MRYRIGMWIGLLLIVGVAASLVWWAKRLPSVPAEPTERGALTVAMPAAPDAPNAPTDIGCRPEGVAANQVRVEWKDTNNGAVDYDLYRREVGGSFSLLSSVTGASCNGGLCEFVDTGAGNSTVYQYRARANDSGDTSAYSSICREPLVLNDSSGNFRAFYRLDDCPDVDGKQVCTQDVNSGGKNVHAQQLLNTAAQYRSTYLALGFRDYAVYDDGKPFPIDLYPCNNGCMGGDGMLIPPANMENHPDYDPDTATSSTDAYKIFTPGHEGFHSLQGKYGDVVDPYYKWLIEGQARSSEDKICIFNQTQCATWDNAVKKYYVGQVQGYLGFPEQGLLDASYNAALFWTYITEQFGTSTAEPAYGVDALIGYWLQNQDNTDAGNPKDGIGTLNDLFDSLGSNRTFTTVFQDFAVANYAKEYITEPAPAGFKKYNYVDEEAMAAGTYDPVKLTVSGPLDPDQSIYDETSLQAWGARYFEVDPAVPVVNIEVETLPATPHSLYYHVLAIKNGAIVNQWSDTGTSYTKSISNASNYDRIALIVASMDNAVNFNYGFNLSDGLFILSPTTQVPATVGEATAPGKFILEVQVLDEDGDPVAGIDTSEMTIMVGSQVLSPTLIIGSSYLAGQYWITVRAPTTPGCAPCDLSVTYSSYSDTKPDAIVYGPKPDADNMIVIDRSGSMKGTKINAAKDAARLYVDSYSEGDRVGVLSFNILNTLEYALTGWTNTTSGEAKTAIDNIVAPAGSTATGGALREATAQLEAQGSPNPVWAIVLLADGLDNAADENDHIPAYLDEYGDKKKAGDPIPIIHVVAIGDDADGVELSKVSNASGGKYDFLPEPGAVAADMGSINAVNFTEELSEIYRTFAEDVLGEQQVYVNHFSNPASVVVSEIQVDGAASQAIFVLKYSPADATVQTVHLVKPDDTEVAPTISDDGHMLWRVPIGAGETGKWKLSVRSLCAECADHYMVEAALVSDLELHAFLGVPEEERIVGKPMPIVAFLADIEPLTGAAVTATSERTGEKITLHDDGMHGDGAAGDGAYGGTLVYTNVPGGYPVIVDAAGTSPFNGDYTRRARLSFYLPDGPDKDGDRLPNWWEEQYPCMDPTVIDEHLDLDGDNLPNSQEYFRKTNPCDPDTDDGGENDGSEVNRKADPLFPGDDNTHSVTFNPWPGVNVAILRLVFSSRVSSFDVERSTSPTGTFTLIGDDLSPMTEWRDESAANDQMACYRIIATGRGYTSTSPVHCTTPKADPHPPHGIVNGVTVLAWARVDGASASQATAPAAIQAKVPPTLTLNLEAEDNPYTEEHPPFGGAFLFPDAIQTGVNEMMISNRADFQGAVWEPYSTEKKWALDVRPDNTATVYALFKDGAGNISDVAVAAFDVDPNLVDGVRLFMPNLSR